MTEAVWMTCTDPQKMVEFLRHEYSMRKFRLFAVACCRKITHLMLKTKLGYRAVVMAEKLADGLPIAENLDQFRERLHNDDYDFGPIDRESWRATKEDYVIFNSGGAAYYALEEDRYFIGEIEKEYEKPGVMEVLNQVAKAAAYWEGETSRQCRQGLKKTWIPRELRKLVPVIHEVFGNPFRPLPQIPSVILDWNDGTARRIAQVIYEERAFERMPILADALEEAGCTDADILNHCRQLGEHARGCWVVDLLLGRS